MKFVILINDQVIALLERLSELKSPAIIRREQSCRAAQKNWRPTRVALVDDMTALEIGALLQENPGSNGNIAHMLNRWPVLFVADLDRELDGE